MKFVSPLRALTWIAAFFLLFSCGRKQMPATATSMGSDVDKVLLDTFADLQILQYELPGWNKLDLRQKTFIYYLSEATLAGRDIIYDQHCKMNLTVRKTLETVFNTYKGDRNSADWKAFELYAKRVWFSNGIHHHYNETKMIPGCSQAYFTSLVKGADAKMLPLATGEDVNAFLARLLPVVFDPTVFPKRTSKDASTDVVKGSSVNFYENVTAEQVDDFYGKMLDAAGPNPPSFGLNSKLVSENGKLKEIVWRAGAGNMYGAALDKVVENLEKAIPFAENAQQKKALGLLVEYFKSGDLKKFDEYNMAWVKDTESKIDLINGFIEVYHDPKGYKADFEAMVQYNDPEATEKMAIVSKNAQYFEDNSTIPAAYKKKKVQGVSYRVINVAMEGGDCAPSTPIGVNLPNSNWIRELGSKSVSLNNIENAYGKAGGALATAEFANDPEEIENARKYAEACGKMHTALHEVIGHASGQMKPGMPEPNITLKQYASTLEEGRADLVALYYMPDPKLVEWGLLPDANAYKAEYDNYIRNGLLMQLRRLQPGHDIEEDHMRNRQLVAAWALEKGKSNNVIVKEVRNGKIYYDIRDYAKLRVLFGQLLSELQRIKSEGDFNAARELVETYGVKTDAETGKQVKARYASLPTKAYSGFVQPKLIAVKNASGKIIDIKVERELDFVKQMLRYGKEYGFLPSLN
ncbi:MAG TPA: dihydrofolate reductase [Saprospiraceae bacterium]|nr:dihydrofolate reductase [Saprospiraceae bacterium]HPI04768.1 dihydrofolate reductase [Saprospiraceae bacterium]